METNNPSNRHILFADQDVVLCVSARRALKRVGFAVTLVHDGTEAIDRFEQELFDVIVLGAALPARDSLQVLQDIKQRDRDVPVIIIGDPLSDLGAQATKAGAFAYLSIPNDNFDELVDTINRALLRHESTPTPEPAAEPPGALEPPAPPRSNPIAALRELIKTVPNESLSTSIQLLLQASADAVHAEHAVLLLAQPDAGLLLHDALGFSDQAEAAGDFVLNVGDTFAWRVATERQTLVDSLPMFEGASPQGFIGTPLSIRDQVLGVLIAYPLSSITVDPVEVAWLESFAAQGALAIQLSRLEVENQRLTPNDPLTGALKQAVFLDVAEHEFRRSWRYSQAISVIVVTVEGLAGIYSTNSRQVGDEVLRQVAGLCRRTVRSIDLVGRLDDDSIALLLLMTDRADAKGAAERVRAAIGSINLSGAQGPLRITASLGVCSYPRENCASIYDLLEVTKQAQRAAQRSGLNQMVQV